MAQVVVVGDDLTGSNATGALFARHGLRAVTVGDADRARRWAGRTDVLVVNTGSRHFPPDDAYAAVRAALSGSRSGGDAALVVKRVDTTLRGNLGRELEAVLDELANDTGARRTRVLAVPAFPDAGRTTVGGLHLVDGVPLARTAVAGDPFNPVHHSRIAAILREQSALTTSELALDVIEAGPDAVVAELRAGQATVVICDATENAHLRTVAAAAARLSDESAIRWVSLDSGPFGVELARHLGIRSAGGPVARVLAVVGSATARTHEQLARAEALLGARFVDLEPESDIPDPRALVGSLRATAETGADVLGVRVSHTGLVRDPAAAERILRCLSAVAVQAVDDPSLRIGALYVSGGDVAAAVTDVLGAEGFATETEVLPLAVVGHLVGGPHDGLPFATKGGLVGGPDAATACLEQLRATCIRQASGEGARAERITARQP